MNGSVRRSCLSFFTPQGPQDDPGVLPRAVHAIFQSLEQQQSQHSRKRVLISFYEVYNDLVYDLLSGTASNGSGAFFLMMCAKVLCKYVHTHTKLRPECHLALLFLCSIRHNARTVTPVGSQPPAHAAVLPAAAHATHAATSTTTATANGSGSRRQQGHKCTASCWGQS